MKLPEFTEKFKMDCILKSSFWTDPEVEDLSQEIKFTLLWLMSNPSRDNCGFTHASNKRFTFETGLPAEYLTRACEALPKSFVRASEGVYFCKKFIRNSFGKGGPLNIEDKVIVSISRHARKLPEALAMAFFSAYPELLEIPAKSSPRNDKSTSPSQGLPLFQEGVIEENRIEENGIKEEGSGEKPAAASPASTAAPVDFLKIVSLYPRRQKLNEALEHLRRSILAGADPDEISAQTTAHAAVIARMPSGALNAYVPSAAAFFQHERWRDDPETLLRNASKNGTVTPSKIDLGGRKGTTFGLENPFPEPPTDSENDSY